jgi:hypothetical protein
LGVHEAEVFDVATPSGDGEPGVPTRRAATRRGADGTHVETGASQQPRHERVRVPHLAGAGLVATPRARRELADGGDDALGHGPVDAHPPGASDRG